MDSLKKGVVDFLSTKLNASRPVLLAYSGGPDSLALLQLLLEYKKQHPLSLALAHVDHGWRPESSSEANEIVLMGQNLGLQVHIKRLNPGLMQGNLEAACREERLKFFLELCHQCDYQAILLAHHADDVAETVLKRVLEGSSLMALGTMQPESLFSGIRLWRPLLRFSKQDLIAYLNRLGLTAYIDSTNLDEKFYRGKCRTRIFPWLTKEFGKEIKSNLCQLSQEAAELKSYLNDRVQIYAKKIIQSPLGYLLDLSQECPMADLELKQLIRHFCEPAKLVLSRDAFEKTLTLIKQNAANKMIQMGKKELIIDRRRLFICTQPLCPLPPESKVLPDNQWIIFGSWKVKMETVQSIDNNNHTSGWDTLWTGKVSFRLPRGEYSIGRPKLTDAYPKSLPISKWWTDHKIPAFLRHHVPVIYENQKVKYEFLTGTYKNNTLDIRKDTQISIVNLAVECE